MNNEVYGGRGASDIKKLGRVMEGTLKDINFRIKEVNFLDVGSNETAMFSPRGIRGTNDTQMLDGG